MSGLKVQLLEALYSKLSEDYDPINREYFDVFQFIYTELTKKNSPEEIVNKLNNMDQSLFFFAVPSLNKEGTTYINGPARGTAIIRVSNEVLEKVKDQEPLNGAIILSNHIYGLLCHEDIHQQQVNRIPKEKRISIKYKEKLDYYKDPAEIAAFANTAAFEILSFLGYKKAMQHIHDYLFLCEISTEFKRYYGFFGMSKSAEERKVFYRFMKYLVHFIDINKERFSI